jgi:hypothetical protein
MPLQNPSHSPRHSCLLAAVALVALIAAPLDAADWPMARFDACRSGASPQKLADKLHLNWVRDYPALEPAWPD